MTSRCTELGPFSTIGTDLAAMSSEAVNIYTGQPKYNSNSLPATSHPQCHHSPHRALPLGYTLLPNLDTSVMHLPPYLPLGNQSYCRDTRYRVLSPPPPPRPLQRPNMFAKTESKKELPQRLPKQVITSPKHASFVGTEMTGKSVLEVPGVGRQMAQRFREDEAQLLFGRKFFTAEELFANYLEDKTAFLTRMRAIGVNETNRSRIINSFEDWIERHQS